VRSGLALKNWRSRALRPWRARASRIADRLEVPIDEDAVQSEYYYGRLAAKLARKMPAGHPELLKARFQHARALYRLGRHEQAEREWRDLVELGSTLPRPLSAAADDYLNGAAHGRAAALYAMGQYAAAEELWQSLAAADERTAGRDAYMTLMVKSDRARALSELGRLGEAEALLAEVVARQTAAAGAEDPDTLNSRAWHAKILCRLERHAEAEEEYRAVEPAFRQIAEAKERELGAAHPKTLGAYAEHAVLLYELGRLEEAEAEFSRVLAGRERSGDADEEGIRDAKQWLEAIRHKLNRE
jgi:eukaryotic-like serine/threonine-protein kinase